MEYVVGIGEYAISYSAGDIIKTYALSSCVAVTLYNPIKKAAGMVHIALPAPLYEEEGVEHPGKYATTAIPLLVKTMCNRLNCSKNQFQVKLFGGADSIRGDDVFNIGAKNVAAALETLKSLNLRHEYTDVGGVLARTLEMEVTTGKIRVYTRPINI